jgi:acetyl esterase/lipase
VSSPELKEFADFYADLTRRFALTQSVELWRDISERIHQLATEPENVTYREVTANGVPGIMVIPADSSPEQVLLHSHSGGGMVASMWQERKAVEHLAKAAGSRALVINYRLAPENKFPAQIDDVEAAFRWLLDQGYQPSRIASTGDSIGGNLALNLALTRLRKNATLPGAVLSISPWLDMELKSKAIDANAHTDRMLSRELLSGFRGAMLDGTGVAINDPRINLVSADPAGLPPRFIYYGDYEILTDDSKSSPSGLVRPGSTSNSTRYPRGSTTSS